MRYTIEGFSQEYAITLRKNVVSGSKTKEIKIDCTDLVILRWFVDFYPNMKKMTVDGQEYAWLSHKKLNDDLPILDISKRSCIDRMQKLVEFGILKYKLVKEGGTFSLYTFGENYINLIARKNAHGMQSNDIGVCGSNSTDGMQSNDTGVCGQTTNKDNTIIDTNIKDNNNNIVPIPKKGFTPPTVEEISEYCKSRNNNVDPQKFFDYYSAAEWTDAKGKKVRNWKQKVITWERNDNNGGKTYGATGIEIKKPAVDDLAGIL